MEFALIKPLSQEITAKSELSNRHDSVKVRAETEHTVMALDTPMPFQDMRN